MRGPYESRFRGTRCCLRRYRAYNGGMDEVASRTRWVATIAGIAILGGGCSDRTIFRPDFTLSVGQPRVVAYDVWPFVAFSPDGREAAYCRSDKKSAWLCTFDIESGGEKVLPGQFPGIVYTPVLFNQTRTSIYCLTGGLISSEDKGSRLVEVERVTGKTINVYGGETRYDPPEFANQDFTLVVLGRNRNYSVLSSDGSLVKVPLPLGGFDTYGNYRARAPSTFVVFNPLNVHRSLGDARAVTLFGLRFRGSMSLAKQDLSKDFEDSHVDAAAIWLTDSKAKRPPDKANEMRSPHGWRAALVEACPDVFEFGSVPGRDAVFVSTFADLRIVKYAKSDPISYDEAAPSISPGKKPGTVIRYRLVTRASY